MGLKGKKSDAHPLSNPAHRVNESSADPRNRMDPMKAQLRSTLLPGLAALLLCLPCAQGQEFEPLFKDDLSDATFPEGVWSRDGEGVLTATKDQILWTKADYQDFILRLEFKNGEGTNSGVFVHASDTKAWVTDSIEVQIADDFSEKWLSKPHSWQCGAIFGRQAAYARAVKPAGEWNRMIVICSGPLITVHLNGVRVNSIDLRDFTSAVTNPDGSTPPPWLSKPPASLPLKGKIGFQGRHGDAPIYLRNLEVMKL